MDFCSGGDLSLHLPLPPLSARFYLAELLSALAYLHSHDIIYRDLKPENIFIDTSGHLKLGDFGLAKIGINGNQKAMSFCGTPAYLAPEVVMGKGGGREGDVWGFGVVMFECLEGVGCWGEGEGMWKRIVEGEVDVAGMEESAGKLIKVC